MSAEYSALGRIEDERIMGVLDELTGDQRAVVALRVMTGFTLEETAEIMGKSIGSIKQLQRRSFEPLRKRVAEEA